MEIWFSKSILATLCIVPSFIAIPFMKFRYGVDHWFFCHGISERLQSVSPYTCHSVGVGERSCRQCVLAVILLIGAVFGALANGALFRAIGLALINLPPVMYATSSMLVFFLSVALASSFPALFKRSLPILGGLQVSCWF